jgi:hypothetical protein
VQSVCRNGFVSHEKLSYRNLQCTHYYRSFWTEKPIKGIGCLHFKVEPLSVTNDLIAERHYGVGFSFLKKPGLGHKDHCRIEIAPDRRKAGFGRYIRCGATAIPWIEHDCSRRQLHSEKC